MGKAETKNKNVAMASRMKALGIQRRNSTCPVCSKVMGGPHQLQTHVAKCGGNYKHYVTEAPVPRRYPLSHEARLALDSLPKPGEYIERSDYNEEYRR